jgi:MarR family transcriptional regulator for hemolysin
MAISDAGGAKTLVPGEQPPDAPGYLLHLLAAISRYRDIALDHALQELGLSAARYRALNAIAAFKSCLMGELSDLIGVDRTTMTRTVDQLVEAGYVERFRTPADRRQVLLQATDLGLRLVERGAPIVAELNSRVLEGVSDAAQRTMIRAEQRMFANLAVNPRTIRRMLAFRGSEADA